MIRTAVHSDLPTLVAWNRAMALETEALSLDPARLEAGVRAVLDDPALGEYFVAEVDGLPVGQLLVTREWSDWRNAAVWWIQSVFVPQEHRGAGHFGALYGFVRDRAQSQGAAGLRLYVDLRNERAMAVYSALGMSGDHYRVFEEMF
ncbi:MAG: GNAT family N-acetyltransferase [Deltaproteobacteria bacterium]|nr:GNAT family N-acetyltransferase [Deltaproteobacteria bacterium]